VVSTSVRAAVPSDSLWRGTRSRRCQSGAVVLQPLDSRGYASLAGSQSRCDPQGGLDEPVGRKTQRIVVSPDYKDLKDMSQHPTRTRSIKLAMVGLLLLPEITKPGDVSDGTSKSGTDSCSTNCSLERAKLFVALALHLPRSASSCGVDL